jgi:hypothetical protein
MKAWQYFVANYGPEGRQAPLFTGLGPLLFGAPSHNLHIERYHRTIKRVLKPNFNIARFCLGLETLDTIFIRKDLMTEEGIRSIKKSKFQTDYSAIHPKQEEIQNYSIEQNSVGYVVIRKDSDGKRNDPI